MAQQGAAGEKLSFYEGLRALPRVQAAPAVSKRARGAVALLALAALALFGASFTQPWWGFKLYAPQYPKGLTLVISLTGMGGDVEEIDILNHYIGMAPLAEAAPLERQLAGWGVLAVCVVTVVGLAFAGKKLEKLAALPALSFPIVFLADSFAWLYTFGHELDPKAPIKLAPFTPEMFGNGQIGQFATFAEPAIGFWLALAAALCAVLAVFLRSRAWIGCSRAKTCAWVCPHFLFSRGKVGPR